MFREGLLYTSIRHMILFPRLQVLRDIQEVVFLVMTKSGFESAVMI